MTNVSLFIGTIAALPDSGRPTGMFKHPVSSSLHLGHAGFAGDEQADRRVHGGPEKAVHLYPATHYARLAQAFPQLAGRLKPGSLGENISSPTLDESQVRIGEVFRLGNARLQLCQPRNPCWKIDERSGTEGVAAFIARHQLTGWYFRVLEPGTVSPGDPLAVVDAATEAPSLAEAMRLWELHRPAPETLRQLAATPGIAAQWQRKIVERADWLDRQLAQSGATAAAFHVKPEDR
jgi:MOSC domain-containing protein YiiM